MTETRPVENNTRNPRLDVLRGIAIIAVLFNHADTRTIIGEFGWLGVDLFFVLSGYLISRLLFVEYKRRKHISVRRFLWRRSLRIMPAFYGFALVSITYSLLLEGHSFEIRQILAELLYVQNYLEGIWVHTWSLGVEEQFYLGFVMLVWLLAKGRVIEKAVIMIPFWVLAWLSLVWLKFQFVSESQSPEPIFFVETHLRGEGLLLGVMLGYLQAFFPQKVMIDTPGRWLLFYLSLVAVFAIVPLSMAGYDKMVSWGLSITNLGFAGLVWLAIQPFELKKSMSKTLVKPLIGMLGWVGIHSYAIYLWHLNVRGLMRNWFPEQDMIAGLLYFALAVLIGWLATLCIEKPIMKWRNERWPGIT